MENNKKSNIYYYMNITIIAIILAVMVMILFAKMEVSAAENNTYNYTITQNYWHSGYGTMFKKEIKITTNTRYAYTLVNDVYTAYFNYLGQTTIVNGSLISRSGTIKVYNGEEIYQDETELQDSQGLDFTIHDSKDNMVTNIPIFSSVEQVTNYLISGDDSGRLNSPFDTLGDTPPVEVDVNNSSTYLTDYKLTGFTADYIINAKWTGIQYPAAMKNYIEKGNMEVLEEKVMVMFGYAYKNAPTQIALTKWYPGSINTTDKQIKIDVNEYKPTDENLYLFYVTFMPVIKYKSYVGLGTSSQFTVWNYGSKNTVYFDLDKDTLKPKDGTIKTDTGNMNNGTGTDLVWSNDSNIIVTDINSAMNYLINFLESFKGVAQKIANVIIVFFSWIPVFGSVIAAVIIICIILRITGR